MSLYAAIAWSSQSSTFSQDPYNIRYINSLVKGKQTKSKTKQFYDKIHLKIHVILKHSDAEMSFGSFLIKRKIPQWRTISMCLETVSFPRNVLNFTVLFLTFVRLHTLRSLETHRKLLKREQ